MESDPSFKQLIPYCIFEYDDGQGVRVFNYTRGSGQGESRLHSKRSVGVGGHISTLDEHGHCPYEVGMQRELDEEVAIETRYQSSCVGLINDDSNDVGAVHLGVVHVMRVEQPLIRPNEEDISEAGFAPVSELLDDFDRFETWSQICLKSLYSS